MIKQDSCTGMKILIMKDICSLKQHILMLVDVLQKDFKRFPVEQLYCELGLNCLITFSLA